MEMNVNPDLIISQRNARAWSQQQLADISGLSLRTIQRIEKTGVSSHDSLQAICSAFDEEPSYFLISVDKSTTHQYTRKIMALCLSIVAIGVGGFYLAQASAETVGLNVRYQSENTDTHDSNPHNSNEGNWTYLATVGSSSELGLPDNFVLLIHPRNSDNGDITLDVSLKNATTDGNTFSTQPLPRVSGNLDNGVTITLEQEGGLMVSIIVSAAE